MTCFKKFAINFNIEMNLRRENTIAVCHTHFAVQDFHMFQNNQRNVNIYTYFYICKYEKKLFVGIFCVVSRFKT